MAVSVNEHHKPRSVLMTEADAGPIMNLPLFSTDIATFNENMVMANITVVNNYHHVASVKDTQFS